jgi:hypothetical protein
MNRNIVTTILVLGLFVFPLGTSWLLDLPWIYQNWSRRAIIYLLMLFEIVALVVMLKNHFKNTNI